MTKRLLKAHRGRGVYANSEPGVGTWMTVEALPAPDLSDPALALTAALTPPTACGLPGGLDGATPRSDAERSRLADRTLAAWGIRSRS